MKTKLAVLVAIILCLAMLACTVSQVTVCLNLAATATSVASTTVANVGNMDSTLRSQIVTYLSATSTALTSAATILKGGTITSAQIASIAAALTSSVAPALPDSVPASVKSTLATVTSAVQSFLSVLESQQTVKASAGRYGVTTFRFDLTRKDKGLISDSLRELVKADAALATVH